MNTQPLFDPIAFLDSLDMMPGSFLDDLRAALDHIADFRDMVVAASLDKDEGLAEDVSGDFLHAIIDQRHRTNRPKRKWYSPKTKIGDHTGSSRRSLKAGITFHHTAVKGGFGPDKKIIAGYMAEIEDVGELDMTRFLKASRELTPEEYSRALALCHRFRGDPARKYNMGVPYHALSCANSVLVLNLPFDWCTWHGNGSNTHFLGYGWDALSSAESCAETADDLIADIVAIHEIGQKEGHFANGCEFTTHAAWTNKALDPGAEFIELVMMPAAKEIGATMRMDFKSSYRGAKSMNDVLERAR